MRHQQHHQQCTAIYARCVSVLQHIGQHGCSKYSTFLSIGQHLKIGNDGAVQMLPAGGRDPHTTRYARRTGADDNSTSGHPSCIPEKQRALVSSRLCLSSYAKPKPLPIFNDGKPYHIRLNKAHSGPAGCSIIEARSKPGGKKRDEKCVSA